MKKLFFIPILLLACMGMRATDVSDFSGLSAALSASGTDDVTLTSNITLTADITIYGTKTIDFSTYTITAGDYTIYIPSGAEVVFNGTTGGITKTKASAAKGCVTMNGGVATFEGGLYQCTPVSGTTQAVRSNAGSTLRIHGGVFNAKSRAILLANSSFEMTNGVVGKESSSSSTYGIYVMSATVNMSLSGGTIYGSNTAVYSSVTTNIVISDSIQIEGAKGLYLTRGSVNITGGTIDASTNALNFESQKSGGGISIEISDGEILGQNGFSIYESLAADASVTSISSISITGGNFAGGVSMSSSMMDRISEGEGFISGGIWDTNVMKYCALGYEAVLEDCEVHIQTCLVPAVIVNGKKFNYKLESNPNPLIDGYYGTPLAAFFGAIDFLHNNGRTNDTITLLSPITIPNSVDGFEGTTIAFDDTVLFDFGKYTISVDNFTFAANADSKVTFRATTGGITKSASGNVACVLANGDVTFEGGLYRAANANQSVRANISGARITIKDGSFKASTRVIALSGGTSLIMSNGQLNGTTYGVYTFSALTDMEISGGEISAATGIYSTGSILVSDSAYVHGINTGIDYRRGTLTINGGRVSGGTHCIDMSSYNTIYRNDSVFISNGAFEGALTVSETLQNKVTLEGGIISGGYWKDLNPATPFNYLVEDRWTHYITDNDTYLHWYEVVENSMYMQSIAHAPWQEATTWDSLIVPTRSSYLEIVNGYNVTVDASATNLDAAARRLIIDNGSLTVEDGTTLIVDTLKINADGRLIIAPTAVVSVGVGGLKSPKADAVVVQADATGTGVLRFNPSATSNNHPLATVQMFLKSHKEGDTFRSQHVGEPLCDTITADSIIRPAGTYVDKLWWKGWEAINSWKDLRPFVGYAFSVNSATAPTSPYVFKGKVVGNMNATYKWQKGYYNLFGNSYTAPMSIRALFNALEAAYEGDSSYPDTLGLADYTVWIYDMDARQHETITREDVATTDRYIAPMQGFILWCDSVMMPDRNYDRSFTLTYANAVWNIDEPDTIGVPITAPALRKELGDEEDDVWYEEPEPVVVDMSVIADIVITSATSHDKVTLREGEQYTSAYDNGADARKLMADAVFNVFGQNEDLALSHIAKDNLSGTTLTLQARDEMTYTMSFGRVNNFDYAIRDVVTDQVIDVVEGNTYTFNVTPNTTAYDRFVLEAGDHKLPTGCEKVVTSKHMGVYTMLGQYLGTAEQLNNLPAGVYVVNGQRVVK